METQKSGSNSTDYKLYDKWTLWAHLPHDTDWTFDSYTRILTFDTVEAIITLLETIPDEMITNCMLFIMRDGIKPMWEDPKNRKGGCDRRYKSASNYQWDYYFSKEKLLYCKNLVG
jgi:hypothetical protein